MPPLRGGAALCLGCGLLPPGVDLEERPRWSLPVAWQEADEPGPAVGRLDLLRHRVSFQGRREGGPYAAAIHRGEIVGTRRGLRLRERISNHQTLLIERRFGQIVLVSSLAGAGVLAELARALEDAF